MAAAPARLHHGIQVLRAADALSVLFSHASMLAPAPPGAFEPAATESWVFGVDLFCVVSGSAIAASAAPGATGAVSAATSFTIAAIAGSAPVRLSANAAGVPHHPVQRKNRCGPTAAILSRLDCQYGTTVCV